MIRLTGIVGMVASSGLLAWYQCLSKSERKEADAKATEAAQRLYHLALGQLPIAHTNPLLEIFRRN